jgi:molybdopterin-synthase adenylyltransferase
MKPLVYLQEDQVDLLFRGTGKTGKAFNGFAIGIDNFTVFHVCTDLTVQIPVGKAIDAFIIILPTAESLLKSKSLIPQYIPNMNEDNLSLIIFLIIDKNVLKHRCFVVKKLEINECDVKFIPVKSDLYSRSKGLLETEILAQKKVGIVGLGSGGSAIAIELAKAGVGKFVLIDFDRLELCNIARHICGINDLGRLKTFAVRDAILQKNPHAEIETLEIDVNQYQNECSIALSKTDIIVGASDNDRSRFFLNEIALRNKTPAIFGRALTRATGGDVLRVRPFQGPCYSCLYSQNVRNEGSDDEEISQEKQAKALMPEYTSEKDLKAVVQVGLSSDIAPISIMMVKLALVELSRGLSSGIKSLEDDLIADFYIWANRRENIYEKWNKLEYNFDKPTILRWYGAKVKRDPNCMVCGQ